MVHAGFLNHADEGDGQAKHLDGKVHIFIKHGFD